MTVLSACQSATVRLVGRRPSSIFSSTDQLELEIADLANEAARDICTLDWQALTKIHTMSADGTATAFPFPEDYDRMPLEADVFDDANWAWGYTHVRGINDWTRLVRSNFQMISPGAWTILQNQFQFYPAPASGTAAVFPYISNQFALSQAAELKTEFTQDTDTFLLDERLLTLEIIWRWRAQKRLEYAEDMANAEKARSERYGKDKGPRILRTIGRNSGRADVTTAYPRALG